MAERKIEVDRIENIVNVFGSFDQNIRIIETELDVAVTDRDSSLRISGGEENVALAERPSTALFPSRPGARALTLRMCVIF